MFIDDVQAMLQQSERVPEMKEMHFPAIWRPKFQTFSLQC